MSNGEIVRAWKDPEADRSGAAFPLGELDLSDVTGGLMSNTGESWCGSCYISTFGCC